VEKLYKTKVITNEIERDFEKKGLRQVNLDPGYITEAKVILFSTKNFYHRIYIGDGIFGEVTLSYKAKKGFEAFPWTFPDYKTEEMMGFMNDIREWYRVVLGRKRKKTDYKLKDNTENL
jgi:hypothetical protein